MAPNTRHIASTKTRNRSKIIWQRNRRIESPTMTKANDLIVATLLIQNCSKPDLVTRLKNQFMTGAKDWYPETPREACTLIESYDNNNNHNNNNNSTDAVVAAHVTVRETTPEASIAELDGSSVAESTATEQEASKDTEHDQIEPDVLRANILVAVRNGTLGDQGFDEEDDDSFVSVDTAESDGKVICILRHMPNPIDVIDAEENVILPIPMAVDLPNPLDNIDIVENVVILPPPIAVCEPRDEPIGFNNINIEESVIM